MRNLDEVPTPIIQLDLQTVREFTEVWKPILDFPPYQVSNLGKVRGHRGIMKQTVNTTGYLKLNLGSGKTRKTLKVHRLVLTAFAGQCPPGLETNHRNGIKTDNRLENLEWTSHSQNMLHADRLGLRNFIHMTGTKNPIAKLNDQKVREIRFLASVGASKQALGAVYGCTKENIHAVLTGKTWNHVI